MMHKILLISLILSLHVHSLAEYNLNVNGRRIHNLGVDMYIGNNQFKKNKKLACDLFTESVKINFLKSYYYLSLCYKDGVADNYRKNIDKSLKLLTDAIEKGLSGYELELADLYIRYRPKSAYKVESYINAYLKEHKDEWGNRNFYLGYLYFIGLSKNINKTKGISYLLRSMLNGNIYAMSFFAYIADNGIYLDGKFNKKFAKEIKETILDFNRIGKNILEENYRVAKQSNSDITYKDAISYLEKNNFFKQILKNKTKDEIRNILK